MHIARELFPTSRMQMLNCQRAERFRHEQFQILTLGLLALMLVLSPGCATQRGVTINNPSDLTKLPIEVLMEIPASKIKSAPEAWKGATRSFPQVVFDAEGSVS